MDDIYFLAAISAVIPGLGRVTLRRLLDNGLSAEKIFRSTYSDLLATNLCNAKQANCFIANRDSDLPQKIFSLCQHGSVKLLSIYDPVYPHLLRQSSDPPLLLYLAGQMPQNPCALAVVGSRMCSAYGRKAAAYFAGSLAQENITIVSGGARGIDTAAHHACIEAGGQTIAVMGCGLDKYYPEENFLLFKRICEKGAIISEYAPGMLPLAKNFPARNRIIAGLCQGVLLAEARIKSGALITAHIAADENREVYCVPGNIFEGFSEGCHQLLQQGAKLVERPQDILEDLQCWRNQKSNTFKGRKLVNYTDSQLEVNKNNCAPILESSLAQKLLVLLEQGSLSLEELTEQSGNDLSVVSMELLQLQLAGYIHESGDRRYRRI